MENLRTRESGFFDEKFASLVYYMHMLDGEELQKPMDRESQLLQEMKEDTQLLVKMGLAQKIIKSENDHRGTRDPMINPETFHFHLVNHPERPEGMDPRHQAY